MRFYQSKVIQVATPEQNGKVEGYYADTVNDLRAYVRSEEKDFYDVLQVNEDGGIYCNGFYWKYFYPVKEVERTGLKGDGCLIFSETSKEVCDSYKNYYGFYSKVCTEDAYDSLKRKLKGCSGQLLGFSEYGFIVDRDIQDSPRTEADFDFFIPVTDDRQEFLKFLKEPTETTEETSSNYVEGNLYDVDRAIKENLPIGTKGYFGLKHDSISHFNFSSDSAYGEIMGLKPDSFVIRYRGNILDDGVKYFYPYDLAKRTFYKNKALYIGDFPAKPIQFNFQQCFFADSLTELETNVMTADTSHLGELRSSDGDFFVIDTDNSCKLWYYIYPVNDDVKNPRDEPDTEPSPEHSDSEVMANAGKIYTILSKIIKDFNNAEVGTAEYNNLLYELRGIGEGVRMFGFDLKTETDENSLINTVHFTDDKNNEMFAINIH